LNLAAIPLMAVAQIAGMLVVMISTLSATTASWLGWVASVGADGLVWSGNLVKLAPFVTWRLAPPNAFVVALYYAALVAAWAARLHEVTALRSLSTCICAGCAVWMLWQPWAWIHGRGDGRLHATFMDVGQGDAAFVTFPRGRTLLVDAGGSSGASSFDIGDRVVAPVLRREGVRQLEAIALTHGDADHIGGAGAVVEEFRPREVWEGIPVPRFEPLRLLRAEAGWVGARWTNVQTADVTTIDDVEVIVRNPGIADWERQDVRNDDSIVLELRWGDASVVLTGDIGQQTERAIASSFAPSMLRVLKVPHHGSLTSSSPEFVHALAPSVAVVSVGRSNSFGHPAPAVLDRYKDVGAETFRTDQDGAVTVTTDGHSMEVRTFTGRLLQIQASGQTTTLAHHEDTKSTKP
jgi:competence protein ComEC